MIVLDNETRYQLARQVHLVRDPNVYEVGKIHKHCIIIMTTIRYGGTATEQWLRCCATNRKVAGSIPDDVIGIFH